VTIAEQIAPALDALTAMSAIRKGEGVSSETVSELERELGLALPSSYASFLQTLGFFEGHEFAVQGITGVPRDRLSLVQAVRELRLQSALVRQGDVSRLVPVERLGDAAFVCLDGRSVGIDGEYPVIVFSPVTGQQDVLFETFADYLLARTGTPDPAAEESRRRSASRQSSDDWRRFCDAVDGFAQRHHYDHVIEGGSLPKPGEWRPYRMAVQDVLLGAVVIRHNAAANNLQVDCCLIDDLYEYEANEAARFVVTFLLCEAYRSGGTMEIEFTRNFGRTRGLIPGQIHALARARNVGLQHFGEGRITSTEARALFEAVTDLSESTHARLRELAAMGDLSVEQACYAVHHGDWTPSELAWLLVAAANPGSILSGAVEAEESLLYSRDCNDCCGALLGGRLDRLLATRSVDGMTREDDPVPLTVELAGSALAKLYRCDEPIALAWSRASVNEVVAPGVPILVGVRAWSSAWMRRALADALRSVAALHVESVGPEPVRAVLVPWDFCSLPQTEQDALTSMAQELGVHLLVCPEPLSRLREDATTRLRAGRIVRKC
jgi:SMI1-KNR4 cell-wall